MKRTLINVFKVGFTLGFFCFFVAELQAASIVDLGTLSGDSESYAYGINDAGQIVGTSLSFVDFQPEQQPFLWQNGSMTRLNMPPDTIGEAYSINSAGQIAGYIGGWGAPNGFSLPAVWLNGTPTFISESNGGSAYAINDSGQVVGSIESGHGDTAFMWQNGNLTDLTPAGSPFQYAFNTSATAINAYGVVAGTTHYIPGVEYPAPFVYNSGHATALPSPQSGPLGIDMGHAWGINNSGQIVGDGGFGFPGSWLNGVFTPLLGDGTPYAINDSGVIVGSNGDAVLWQNGGIIDLNSLLPVNSGWTLTDARAINNENQIVGWGTIDGQTHAYLLTVPEPATWLLAAIGVSGLALFARQNRRIDGSLTSMWIAIAIIVPLLTALASQPCNAQTFKTLYSFGTFPASSHGAEPFGDLTLSGSTLYGMTRDGGAGGLGNIFSIPVTGGTPTTLFSLDGTHGANPYGSLILGGSTLYGMTQQDGGNGAGTIFSIPVTGGTPTTLFDFDGTNGLLPYGSFTLSGSTLYGMTANGGANGDGNIFSIPVTGGTPTTLVSFDGTNGMVPYGNLTLSGSTLYGMTSGGGANGGGTIFSIPVTGGTPTTLFSFDGTHGASPLGSLTLDGSTLYGMAASGGTNGLGTIFSIPVTGGTPTTLFDFDGTHGAATTLFDGTGGPLGSLTLRGSTLYGMTPYGGASYGVDTPGYGTIFSIPVTGGTPTILFSFDQLHGENPFGSLTLDGSTLYGMNAYGGPSSDVGTIFSLTVPEPATWALAMIGGIGLAIFRRRSATRSQMRQWNALRCIAWAVTLCSASVQAIEVQAASIVDLGTLPGDSESHAYGINDQGQVVGNSGELRPFIWQNGAMTPLDTNTGFGDAYGINNGSQIVGDVLTGYGFQPVVWNKGTPTVIATPFLGATGSAYAINDAGAVVGTSDYLGAFLWQNGTFVNILTPDGSPIFGGAKAINDLGQVVGAQYLTYGWEPFKYDGGTTTFLPTPYAGWGGEGLGINHSGQVVGYVGSTMPATWINGAFTPLPALDGGIAFAINDAGLIVGGSDGHAVMWQNGVSIDLNSLIPGDLGWTLTDARAINNHDQIVGWGTIDGQTHAYLLTVPEPATSALAVIGGLGMIIFARQRRLRAAKHAQSACPLAACLCVAISYTTYAHAASIVDLGTLPGDSESHAYGINDAGQVVGDSGLVGGAFVWQNGVMTAIDPAHPGHAYAINNAGQIVGDAKWDYSYEYEYQPALWQNGTFTSLGSFWSEQLFGATYFHGAGSAYGINDAGQIVGYTTALYDNGATLNHVAFLWQNGTMVNIDSQEPNPTYGSAANAINSHGDAVGFTSTSFQYIPLSWINGVPAVLEDPFLYSELALGINNLGQIVGQINAQVPCTWINGVLTQLPGLHDQSGIAYAINDAGGIVGSSDGHAVLWQNGAIVDLNSLLSGNSGWTLTDVRAINNHDQIVGWGTIDGQTHAYLLTVPEPSTWLLAAIGAVGLAVFIRHQAATIPARGKTETPSVVPS